MEHITGRIKRKLSGHGIMSKVITAVFIASSVITPLSPVFAATAHADEPETATVTLMDTDNGSLSFDGTDEKSVSVNVGSEVTVNVAPDDGYYADNLTVFDENNKGTAVEVKDGTATFTVNGDSTVYATFNENGSVSADALKPVDVDEQKAITSVEEYVKDHADKKYVGEGDELSRKDVLTVTTTVVDGTKLPDATLDTLWQDTDGDGMSDNYTAMLSQAVSHAVLFEVDPDSDYYVGWAGADIDGAKLTDWAAAENNADAVMRDGFIVDEATGLVYVPKSYTKTDDEGKPMVASSRIQLVYTVDDANAAASFDFASNVSDVNGDVAGEGKVSAPVAAACTKVTLAKDDAALAAIKGNTIDSVTVNGIEYTSDMDMWSYDEATGTLEFFMAPAGVHAMSVKMSNNLGKSVVSLLGLARSGGVNNIGTWKFKSAPVAGMDFTVASHNKYYGNERVPGFVPAVENPSLGNYEEKTIYQALGTQGVNVSSLVSGRYSLMRGTTIHAQSTGGVTIGQSTQLGLTCGHVGLNANFQLQPGYNNETMSDDLGAHVHVVSVSGNTAIIGVTVPTSCTQAGGGFFEITWEIDEGYAKVQKQSANPSITDGNDCYSLEGAEFAVYDAGGSVMGTLTTDASGNTGTIALRPGIYTLRETKVPKGYTKAADQQFTVTGGQTTTITVKDPPAEDPMVMVVGKYDGDKTYNEIEGNMPQGSASLDGAEFTVEYYATLDYDSYDALKKDDVKPTRSWVVRTNSKGSAQLSNQYLVSGDAFYYNNGSVTLPRGSVVVYESKAPTGYKLNNDVNFQKIQEKPLTGVTTFNLPEIPESVIRGGVSVRKLDSQTGQTPQGNASFEGITFSVINDNGNSVIVDGREYAPGAVVTTMTTDKDGHAATAGDALPYGSYIIRETGTNEGYLNTSDEIHATVSEDGTVYDFTASDDVVRGGVEVYKRDLESDLKTPLGAASIDGTQFEVKTLSKNPVKVGGVLYSKGDVVATLTIKDGYAVTSADALPYGEYTLQEVKAGEGYNLTDGTAYKFNISKDGEIVNPVTGDGHVHNQVKRSDLEFNKKAHDSADRLANIPFKVTSKTTGESHVVVTDENGYFNSASSWNKHTENTNGNDWALNADGTIDSSKLDTTAGVWFGLTTEGTMTKAGGSLGALPYDTYTIEELPCTNNEGYTLVSTSIVVTRHGVTYDFGTLDDVPQGTASVSTHAYDPTDGDGSINVGDVTIADKVTYDGLVVNGKYRLVTTVVDASTGDAISVDGKDVSATKDFTAQGTSGYEVVEMSLPTYELGGKTITVYEELYRVDGSSASLVADHRDKDDVDQQLRVIAPEIGTTAKDGVDGDKAVVPDETTTVVDTVAYKNLIPGKEYTVTGTLHVKGTDKDGKVTEEALEVDGKPVTASTTFTPDKADGTVEVTFAFDSTGIKDGTQLVAFETLSQGDHELAVHADIDDYGQTVTIEYPKIGTTAKDGHDGDKNVVADGQTTVIDTVAYKGLIPGKEYTVTGTLHVKGTDKDGNMTDKALEVDGKPVTASTTFTPDKADGTVEVTFAFDSTGIKDGTEVVAFESLDKGGHELAVHADIKDEDQTVTVHESAIGTAATDGLDGDRNVVADAETTVTDTIGYNGVLSGTGYTMAGILMDKATGLPILTGEGSDKFTEDDVKSFMNELSSLTGTDSDETTPVDADALRKLLSDNAELVSHLVFQSAEFTPDTSAGSVSMDFDFDANAVIDRLSGETKDVVVFEVLFKGSLDEDADVAPVVVATELDLDNEDQTVTIVPSTIGTTATDSSDGDHELMAGQDATITDTVSYEDLIPGKEYTLKATMYDKATGEPLSVGDKHVTAELKFTPNSPSGTIDIDLGPFDASGLDGHSLVVFEELYKQSVIDGEATDILVAEHKDLNDEDQTVTVTNAPEGGTIDKTPGGTYGKTGGSDAAIVAVLVLLIAAAGGFTAYGVRKRRAAATESDVEDAAAKPDDGSDD